MNETTAALIKQLAEKLGTTAENLWAILIQQAAIEAATDRIVAIVWSVVTSLLLALAVTIVVLAFKTPKQDTDPYHRHDDSDFAKVGFWIGIVSIITGIISGAYWFAWYSEAHNPAYWALKQVLEALGSK